MVKNRHSRCCYEKLLVFGVIYHNHNLSIGYGRRFPTDAKMFHGIAQFANKFIMRNIFSIAKRRKQQAKLQQFIRAAHGSCVHQIIALKLSVIRPCPTGPQMRQYLMMNINVTGRE